MHSSVDVTAVAHRLWVRSTRDAHTAADVAQAAERLCADLRRGVMPWTGSERYQALLNRAVRDAAVRHPRLGGLLLDQRQLVSRCPTGVDAHRFDAAEVEAVTKAVVTAAIDAVGVMLGEMLAVRMIDQIDFSYAFTPDRGCVVTIQSAVM